MSGMRSSVIKYTEFNYWTFTFEINPNDRTACVECSLFGEVEEKQERTSEGD